MIWRGCVFEPMHPLYPNRAFVPLCAIFSHTKAQRHSLNCLPYVVFVLLLILERQNKQMKSFLLIMGLFLTGITAKGPRFRYLDKTVPVYLHVKSLTNDTDDDVSRYIKDSLLQLHFIFSSSLENSTRSKQFFDEENVSIHLNFTTAFNK